VKIFFTLKHLLGRLTWMILIKLMTFGYALMVPFSKWRILSRIVVWAFQFSLIELVRAKYDNCTAGILVFVLAFMEEVKLLNLLSCLLEFGL